MNKQDRVVLSVRHLEGGFLGRTDALLGQDSAHEDAWPLEHACPLGGGANAKSTKSTGHCPASRTYLKYTQLAPSHRRPSSPRSRRYSACARVSATANRRDESLSSRRNMTCDRS